MSLPGIPPAEAISYPRIQLDGPRKFFAGAYLAYSLSQVASGAWESVDVGAPPAVVHTVEEIAFNSAELTTTEEGLHNLGLIALSAGTIIGLNEGSRRLAIWRHERETP